MRDVTRQLIEDSSHGFGEDVRIVATAKAARDLTPTLTETLARLHANDRTVGFISKALAYSKGLRYGGKREHANLIRLIKGGHVRVYEINEPPPPGSNAKRDSPYGDRYYMLKIEGES